MGWLLWGVAAGWAVCATYYYHQTENNEKAAVGAAIIFILLIGIAFVISVNLGIADGTLGPAKPTPTVEFGR